MITLLLLFAPSAVDEPAASNPRIYSFIGNNATIVGTPSTGRATDPSNRSQERAPTAKPLDYAAIDRRFEASIAEKGMIGLSLGVMRNGEIEHVKGFGSRCLEPKQSVEVDTSFRIGSVTKQFVCALTLLLAEEGRLSLADPIGKHFPQLAGADSITLYDLMNHTSGYRDYYPLDFFDRRMRKDVAAVDLLKEYAGGKLDFPPRTRHSYSNTGYVALGAYIEKTTGEPLGATLRRRLFEPLGLTHTRYSSADDLPLRATGYTAFGLGTPEKASFEPEGWIGPAGGIWSSAPDLLRWSKALSEGKVLRADSFRIMTSPTVLADGAIAPYGCGLSWSLRRGDPVLEHTGGVAGFLSFCMFSPRTRTAVVVLSNGDHLPPFELARETTEFVMGPNDSESREGAPKVDGPAPDQVVKSFLTQLVDGKLDRSKLGAEFSAYLTDSRIADSAKRFRELGSPESIQTTSVYERGGLEGSSIQINFKNRRVRASLFRSAEGKIEQLLFYPR